MSKKIEVEIPEGFELKKISETEFKLVKKLTNLNDIIDSFGKKYSDYGLHFVNGEYERFQVLRDISTVARYLNGDWKPDWINGLEYKWYIILDGGGKNCTVSYTITTNIGGLPVFKTEELAREAIKIIGEDRIVKVFNDYDY